MIEILLLLAIFIITTPFWYSIYRNSLQDRSYDIRKNGYGKFILVKWGGHAPGTVSIKQYDTIEEAREWVKEWVDRDWKNISTVVETFISNK